MNNNINKKNISIIIIIFIIIAIVVIGTYALSLWTSRNNTELTMRIGDVEGSACQTGPNIEVSNVGPIFDYEKDGESTFFSIANFSSETLPVNITLYITSISDNLKTNDFKYVLMTSPDKKTYTKVSEGDFSQTTNNSSIQLINNYQLSGNSAMNFKIIIYIDGNMENSTSLQGGTLNAGLSACSTKAIEATSEETLVHLGLFESVIDDKPNFSKTSCSSGCGETTVGIYKAEDDLGTSYYFRGDVTNNYVKFGKNSSGQDMYWRIIRINGDGTVRMIYMGTDINATTLSAVGTSVFNPARGLPDNTYAGYMYGDTGQSTYALTHSNKYDSSIKTFLEGTEENNYEDGWYYQNIVATGYHDYVADAIYCNDRSLSEGTGIGNIYTEYNASHRLEEAPTLKCDFEDYTNDSFTVNTKLGNGLLKYPVGLITADEAVFAGNANGYDNRKNYLYSGQIDYWTMTPYDSSSFVIRDEDTETIEIKFYTIYDGILSPWNTGDIGSGAQVINSIIPVISLKADALKSGNGTQENPFTISSALATLTQLGLTEYINDTELTIFSSTSAQDGTSGIYKSEDDLGDSYYFRGNVTNNYVKFGKNSSNQDMYWRIIRINGDGSIRMIYDGTQAHNNGVASEDRQVGISVFYNNIITSECYEDEEEGTPYTCVDNGLIGYMNGRTNGTNFPNGGTTSTSYDEAHANITNSTIKTYLENWYETNIVDRYYDQYVTDAIYCNNRKVATNQEIIDWFANENDIHYSTMGYGKSQTLYGIYDVVDADMFWGENGPITPTLKCPQENDKFSTNENIGNGKLSHPVGLITIEETVFAGGNFEPNESFYLYTGNSFWTLSPDSCGDDGSGEGGITCSVRVIEEEGRAVYSAAGYSSSSGVRPVISLKSGVIVHGDGTKGNPFVVDGDV